MAEQGIRIKVDASDATRKVAEAAARAERPRPMFEAIGAALVTSTQRRFELGQSPDGTPWPPSIRATLTGGKTLIDTSRLLQSITYEAGDAHVEVGTNVIYAAVHQFGAVIRPVAAKALRFVIGGREVFAQAAAIPARPFLGLDQEDEKEIEATAEDFIFATEGGRAP